MAAQPALLSSPKGNSGACKVSQALTRTRWRCYHTSTGETWLDSCLDVQLWDGFTPGWHQRWPEHWPKDHTTGRNQGMGGSGASLVASETRAKMAQVVGGKHWKLGAEGWAAAASSRRAGVSSPAAAAARASSLLHTSWLGQLTCSQLFSKQIFLISQLKIPAWSLWR